MIAFVFINFSVVLIQVGNIGGKDFSESLAPDVQKLLVCCFILLFLASHMYYILRVLHLVFQLSNSCRPLVRKKAALCLLRLFRKNPDVVNVDGW